MKRGLSGEYITISTAGEKVRAFIPKSLPPNPPLDLTASLENLEGRFHFPRPEKETLQDLIDQAHLWLGRLDSLSTLLPEPGLFLYMYVRKEAVLSSQIEGTQSSLADLLFYENSAAPGAPLDDVREVSNYVAALDHGLTRIHKGFPLSLRLFREIHHVLLAKGRGSEKDPGEFRRSQNWIGGTRPGNAVFVPPPPDRMMECLGEWEKFLHNHPQKTPLLIKAALAHAQFESIHPFLDGNGRLGRLLITLLLCAEGSLDQPLLYLSLYFKTYRQDYYDLLQEVRLQGNWEAWIAFFMLGIQATARQAVTTAHELIQLFSRDQERIRVLGRAANSALRVHQELQRQPVISVPKAAKMTGLEYPTVKAALLRLARLGIIRDLGQKRNRLFSYDQCIKTLMEEPELIATEPERRRAMAKAFQERAEYWRNKSRLRRSK